MRSTLRGPRRIQVDAEWRVTVARRAGPGNARTPTPLGSVLSPSCLIQSLLDVFCGPAKLQVHDRLGFLGATGGAGSAAVLDIGGGSAQLIVGGRGRSVNVGAVVIAEGCLHSDPPAAPEIEAARARVRRGLAPLFRRATVCAPVLFS